MVSSDVVAYTSFEQLRAWAAQRERWPELCEALAQHAVTDEALFQVLPTVQAEPELAAQLWAVMPQWRAPSLRAWLARRLLPDPGALAAFWALADERARRRDPSFPAVDAVRLVPVARWFAGERLASDQRVEGIGWVLQVEDRDVGPAECIHESEWTAEAHGAGWGLRIHRIASGGLSCKCYEEDL